MHLYRGFMLIVCLYKGLLSYLFFFRSSKFYLCSPLSRGYVSEPIGLSRFECLLNSFANFLQGHQSVLEDLKIRICGFITFFINDCIGNRFASFCK